MLPSCLLLELSLTSGALPPRQCSQGIELWFQACIGLFLLSVGSAFLAQVPVDNSCDTFHQCRSEGGRPWSWVWTGLPNDSTHMLQPQSEGLQKLPDLQGI